GVRYPGGIHDIEMCTFFAEAPDRAFDHRASRVEDDLSRLEHPPDLGQGCCRRLPCRASIAPCILRRVEGCVGAAQQFVQLHTLAVATRSAEASRPLAVPLCTADRPLLERAADLFGNLERSRRVRVWQHDGEFFAPDPAEDVGVAKPFTAHFTIKAQSEEPLIRCARLHKLVGISLLRLVRSL